MRRWREGLGFAPSDALNDVRRTVTDEDAKAGAWARGKRPNTGSSPARRSRR